MSAELPAESVKDEQLHQQAEVAEFVQQDLDQTLDSIVIEPASGDTVRFANKDGEEETWVVKSITEQGVKGTKSAMTTVLLASPDGQKENLRSLDGLVDSMRSHMVESTKSVAETSGLTGALETLYNDDATVAEVADASLEVASLAASLEAPTAKPVHIPKPPATGNTVHIGQGRSKSAYAFDWNDKSNLNSGQKRTGAPRATDWYGSVSSEYSNSPSFAPGEDGGSVEGITVNVFDKTSHVIDRDSNWRRQDEATFSVVARTNADGEKVKPAEITAVMQHGGNSYGWQKVSGHEDEYKAFKDLMKIVGNDVARQMARVQLGEISVEDLEVQQSVKAEAEVVEEASRIIDSTPWSSPSRPAQPGNVTQAGRRVVVTHRPGDPGYDELMARHTLNQATMAAASRAALGQDKESQFIK